MIEIFQDPVVNTTGAQLIFTTHDTSLLDPTLLRRDQISPTSRHEKAKPLKKATCPAGMAVFRS